MVSALIVSLLTGASGTVSRQCDTTLHAEPSDAFFIDNDPTLASDTLTHIPKILLHQGKRDANDEVLYRYYFGKRKRKILHGLYEIRLKSFRPGQLIESGNYRHNLRIGKWTEWYSDGRIKSESFYMDGKRQGNYTVYHPNGIVAERIDFKDDKWNCEDGETIGYYPSGTLKFEARIRNGKLVKEHRYDSTGRPLD